MGSDVILEIDNHAQGLPRSRTVHQPPRSRAKIDEQDIKALLKSRYQNLRRLDGNHPELRLSDSTTPRRKSMPARPHRVSNKTPEVAKRGSVYQSSREIRSMQKLREGKRNLEPDFNDERFLSFEIVDPLPLPSSNKEAVGSPLKRSPLRPVDRDSTGPSIDTQHSLLLKATEFFELSFRDLPQERVKLSSSCSNSANCLKDNVMDFVSNKETNACNLPKSFSAKAVMSNVETSKECPKSRFSPFKKMLDPIMKSKSLRSPSHMESEISDKRHMGFRKSLLNDFSKTTEKMDCDDMLSDNEKVSRSVSSPAHLHASLKLDGRHGAPSYEFSVKDLNDVLQAKTWRTDSAFNWVYTFHSSKRMCSNSSGWGSKERHGQSLPMVGQMQVSCYLCSEMSDSGSLESSTITDFVLYDIAQARRSIVIEEESRRASDTAQPLNFTIGDSLAAESPTAASNSTEYHRRRPSSEFDTDPSTSYPWALSSLHPYLEIAAVVIQIPFNNKEIKGLQNEEDRSVNSLSGQSMEQGSDTTFECMKRSNIKAVVAPCGTHGMPDADEGSPSSLLDRWRLGGGCDCGGWDMACPIVVLDKPFGVSDAADHSVKGKQHQMVLFVQGSKEKIPALSIIHDGRGQYSVDFHAQLSSLQAFSICISILHSSEAASALGQDNKQRLYSNSLKLLLQEEVRHLLEAVADEEKRKAKKKTEQIPPSFILDPPFSPMARV